MLETTITRRTFSMLSLGVVGGAISGCLPRVEGAVEGFPGRPIQMIVPFAAGGPTDVIGRIIADGLAEPLGQNGQRAEVPVINRTGSGGIIGTVQVMNANSDAYTLVTVTGTSYGTQPTSSRRPTGRTP